jgi:DNA-binding NarL/FixJ family response regulator
MIKVLIAEDMHLIRGALTALLEREKDMSVVAELDRGDLIVATALATRPDVAVLDIGLPGVDGLSAAKQLHDVLPECQVVILTGMTQPGNLLRALKVHVRGFIPKDAPARTLADGIRRVAAGERVIDSGHGRGRAGDRREPAHGPGSGRAARGRGRYLHRGDRYAAFPRADDRSQSPVERHRQNRRPQPARRHPDSARRWLAVTFVIFF